jgi:hypothetical protein
MGFLLRSDHKPGSIERNEIGAENDFFGAVLD